MKYLLLILLIISLLLNFAGCAHEDPETKRLNERFALMRLYNRETRAKEVVLIQISEGEVSVPLDRKIISKNFVAYNVIDDVLVLCEETSDKKNIFWSFDITSEVLSDYNTVGELQEAVHVDNIEWKPLWVSNFHLATEE